VNRWLWKNAWACLVLGVLLNLWAPRSTEVRVTATASAAPPADASPPSAARPHELDEGALRFEVEPDDVEIYLDEHYLGRAGELRGRTLEGILPGNRLLELKLAGERTFLQVVVPLNGTRTIRVNLAAPALESS